MTTQLLQGLNQAQREAVEAIDGPLLIIAGPGSGKTRVITHRIAYLARVVGISPHGIMAATFTNKAANEMKGRLSRLIGPRAEGLTVGTFHSFCARVLRRHGQLVGLAPGFGIFDTEDQMELMKAAMEEAEVDHKQFPRRSLHGVISKAKSVLLDAQGLAAQQGSYFEEVAARVYAHYEELMARNNGVDFDDLLLKTVTLFRTAPDVARWYQQRYIHVLIDEFQDTNIAQYALAKLLAEGYRNICVVGDPDQSIYSWRSADIRNILSFREDYPGAKVVTLEVNYRSTQAIIDAAKGVIAGNRQRLAKEILPSRGRGDRLVVHEAYNEEEEARFVVRQVERLLEDTPFKASDCAVMYRVNAQSRALEEAFLRHALPYRIIGGTRFYQRAEVKDLIAYLRLINNPDDEVSLLRVVNKPSRGIGRQSLDRLTHEARRQNIPLSWVLEQVRQERRDRLPPSFPLSPRAAGAVAGFMDMISGFREKKAGLELVELIDLLLEGIDYLGYLKGGADNWEERWENVLELRSVAGEYGGWDPGEGLTAFLEELALVADVDSYDGTTEAVTLITLHQAKGLEFPVVFITGMEEGLLPHSRSMDSPEEVEEERRLCYVGITRCMDRLFLTRSFKRGMYGRSLPTAPSRFLAEVPPRVIASADPVADGGRGLSSRAGGRARRVYSPAAAGAETPAADEEPPQVVFEPGDRVRHAVFGKGMVVQRAGEGRESEVTVAFLGDAGIKRLLVSFAPLQKVEG